MDLEIFRCGSAAASQFSRTDIAHIDFQFMIVWNDGARGVFNSAVKRAVPLLPAAKAELETTAPMTIAAAMAVLTNLLIICP